jgi:hypothetical protein
MTWARPLFDSFETAPDPAPSPAQVGGAILVADCSVIAMQAVLDGLFCWIALTALTTAADSSPIMAWWAGHRTVSRQPRNQPALLQTFDFASL